MKLHKICVSLVVLAGCPPPEDQPSVSDSAASGTSEVGLTADTTPGASETSSTGDEPMSSTSTGEPDPAPGCGNGVVEVGESCDNGSANGDHNDCTSTCVYAFCGDGLVRSSPDNPADIEACDAGEDNLDGAYGGCQSDCTLGPHCGDGVVDEGYEECEPELTEDGPMCMGDCFYEGRVVFVSSAVFTGDFASFVVGGTGLDGADEACRQMADAAGLSVPESFRAWLGSADGSPSSRITPALDSPTVPVRLVDGTAVAMSWQGFVADTHLSPIDVSEYGEEVLDERVWTSVDPSGLTQEPACSQWTSDDFLELGRFGSTGFADKRWTELDLDACLKAFHVYCIQTTMPGEAGL